MDLQLSTTPKGEGHLVASYVCPCGCRPRLKYERGQSHATDDCCCGNQFAVGPKATEHLNQGDAPHLEVQSIQAPWGEPLEAVWTIMQVDGHTAADHDHDHGNEADGPNAIDPVCGMTVDKARTQAAGLVAQHNGTTFWFCGRGCKLEFEEDSPRYLDPSHVPSM